MALLRENKSKNNAGADTALLSEERWQEMDWDKDGTITFKEFLSAMYEWVGTADEISELEAEAEERAAAQAHVPPAGDAAVAAGAGAGAATAASAAGSAPAGDGGVEETKADA